MDITCFKVKFGQLEHLQLLQKGTVYCSTLKYFTELEDGKTRGDEDENAFDFKTFNNPELLIKPANDPKAEYKKLNANWVQMVSRNSNIHGNLLCLHCVDVTLAETEGILEIDEKNGEFGSHVLVLLNTAEFEERVYDELDKRKMKFACGPVEYIDLKNFTGRKSLFQKDLKYSYQNEFRIVIDSNLQTPLLLDIGDISSISKIYEFNKFKRLLFKRP